MKGGMIRVDSAGVVRCRHSPVAGQPTQEEAALGPGRVRLAITWLVTVPLARSGLLAGAALVFLSAMKELPATSGPGAGSCTVGAEGSRKHRGRLPSWRGTGIRSTSTSR
jgi:hypothetical protein